MKRELLFYTSELPDWELTLDVINGIENSEVDAADVNALVRRIVSFAGKFGLAGDLWQQWLTYILMMHENPFTLACERRGVRADSTITELAAGDLGCFRDLFKADLLDEGADAGSAHAAEILRAMTDYRPPYGSVTERGPGAAISLLSERLAHAEDVKTFSLILQDHYETYGVGMYGLYRAFRVDEGISELKLVPVVDDEDVTFDDLIGYEDQKKTLIDNTEAFVSGNHANNVLLYGDSGTGKSTSIHALMHEFFPRGMRLVEVSKQNRHLLPQILSQIKKRNYRFIIFLDDLSFEENESDYKELKAMLEGALETRSDRVLIYATSNRRHLIRETWRDRNDIEYQEDVHHSDTMEEKLSLASRFGVTIYYSKPDPKEYLNIVRQLADRNGIELSSQDLDDIARRWELRHGGMSGRTASQLITWLRGEAAKKTQA